MKEGSTISFRKVKGRVLAFYKTKHGWNLNLLKSNGFTESWNDLSEEEVKKIKTV